MPYEDNTAKLLGLEDVIVNKVWEDEVSRHIEIQLPRHKHNCPCCGTETDRIHDYRRQKVKDISAFGKDVYLYLRKRRYVCGSWGKRFYEDNSFLPRYHRMTSRKNARIIEDFRDAVPASYIARQHNISATTAFRYFNLVNYSCKELPEVLSIDEFKGNADGEKYQTILTDAKDRKIVDILPSLAAIYSHRNLAFIGPAGTGKTHLAQAFGYSCCQNGMKTYFIKASELRDRFTAARRTGKTDSCLSGLVRPTFSLGLFFLFYPNY